MLQFLRNKFDFFHKNVLKNFRSQRLYLPLKSYIKDNSSFCQLERVCFFRCFSRAYQLFVQLVDLRKNTAKDKTPDFEQSRLVLKIHKYTFFICLCITRMFRNQFFSKNIFLTRSFALSLRSFKKNRTSLLQIFQ